MMLYNMNNTQTYDDFCPVRPYDNVIEGLCKRMQLTTCFLNVLQFFLVALMHLNIGKGMYWRILYYASLAGMIGGVSEHATVAYYCTIDRFYKERGLVIPFLANEICWIVKEYAVPFLNLIKLKAFSDGSTSYKIFKYIIVFLFFIFTFFRLYIGWARMTTGQVVSRKSRYGHGGAFITTALADIICTVSILYHVRKHNQENLNNAPEIGHYIKRSSYIILLFVDIAGFALGVLNTATELSNGLISDSYIDPLQCIKTSFILILACDALVFKYSVNYSVSSTSRELSNKDFSNNYSKHNSNYNLNSSMKDYNFSNISNINQTSSLTKINPVFNFSQHNASSCNSKFNSINGFSSHETAEFPSSEYLKRLSLHKSVNLNSKHEYVPY